MFHCNSSPANGSPCFSDNFAGNLCYLWSDPSYYTVRLHSPDSNRFNFVFGDFLQIAQRNKGKLCRIIKIISKAVFIKNRNRKGIYVQYTLVICINQRRFFQKRQIDKRILLQHGKSVIRIGEINCIDSVCVGTQSKFVNCSHYCGMQD